MASVLTQSLLVLLLVSLVSRAQVLYGTGAGTAFGVNKGIGTQAIAQKGLLAAQQSALAKEQASQTAAQAAAAQQSAAQAATQSAAAHQAAYGKAHADQALKQQLLETIDFCAGYICTEWLDEYGLEYVNQAAKSAAVQDAAFAVKQGVSQAQEASRFANMFGSQFNSLAALNKGVGAQAIAAYANEAAALGNLGALYGTGVGTAFGAGAAGVAPFYGWGSFDNLGALGQAGAQLGIGAGKAFGVGQQSAKAFESATAAYDQEAAAKEAASAAAQEKAIASAFGVGEQKQAAAAQTTALNEAQLVRRRSFGRRCRRYQCYHQYAQGDIISYGPNFYVENGNLINAEQAAAAKQAAQGSGFEAARADAAAAADYAGKGAASEFVAGAEAARLAEGVGLHGAEAAGYGVGYAPYVGPYYY